MNYKRAGVDIDKADRLVDWIRARARTTHDGRVRAGVGGFAALYDLGSGRYLASGTDGVGTKLKIAFLLDRHKTIGVDLVAMCANDVICTGARPIFFLDYFATGKLSLRVSKEVLGGIAEGCRQAGCALIGGETAEMPGFYAEGEYDVAGFCVGEVDRGRLIAGKYLRAGDLLVGIGSSGFHSNGFSLIRRWVKPTEKRLLNELLTPTRIYVSSVLGLVDRFGRSIKGLAHITGSGLLNVPRIHPGFDYEILSLPDLSELPPIIATMTQRSGLRPRELYKTFNMGIGMVVATDRAEDVCRYLKGRGERAWVLGEVVRGGGRVRVNHPSGSFVLR
ncbi:MAG: phosphoribosylformylglycinamidine cyclo-ligase [Pseudomonadota bacterium]